MLRPCVDVGFDFRTLRVDICLALLDPLREVGMLKHPIDPRIPANPLAPGVGSISVICVAEA